MLLNPIIKARFNVPKGNFTEIGFDVSLFQPEHFLCWQVDCPPSLECAAPKRQAEFLAGRYLAQLALAEFGFAPSTSIGIGQQRQPLWPEGIVGSITHCEGYAACIVARAADYSGLGIDCEINITSETATNIAITIVSDAEMDSARISNLPFHQWLTLVFSAKESLFKALFKQVGHYFGFLDAQIVELKEAEQSFVLELVADLSPALSAGYRITGRYKHHNNTVITLIAIHS